MSRYDGLIIPRSYSEYINKTDAATLSQALQLSGVMDAAPTENSVKPAKSGGIYAALEGKQPALTFDNVPTDGSNNPVKSNGIYDALAGKQNALTFDDVPTQSSNNPVKSGGVYSALNGTKTLTADLRGWISSTNKFTITTATCTAIKIAGDVYAVFIELLPRNTDPAPSTVLHEIRINNITKILCSGAMFARTTTGVERNVAPQLADNNLAYIRGSTDNWLPTSWGDTALIQYSAIVQA